MNNTFLLFALVHFPLSGIKLFATRRLLRLPTPIVKLITFACLQGATITLSEVILPHLGPKVILLTITHIALHMFIFKAPLFPVALFAIIFPIASGLLGEIIFVYILNLQVSAFPYHFAPYFAWITSIPLALSALIMLLIPKAKNTKVNLLKKRPPKRGLRPYVFYIGVLILHSLCSLHCALRLDSALQLPTIYLYSNVILFPAVGGVLLKYIHTSRKTERAIHYHALKNRAQRSTVKTLRKERHDFLNDLTLISTYLQMGRLEEAQECIRSTAAALSGQYDYPTLPDDAWLTVLGMKQKEAVLRNIDFSLQIDAQPLTDHTDQRLLLKVITNLVDNAFTAVTEVSQPQVRLFWSEQPDGSYLLSVVDNGPPIPPKMGKRIFQPGISSKKGNSENTGWGLTICKRIAKELGGTLDFKSTERQTSFDLILPRDENLPQNNLSAINPAKALYFPGPYKLFSPEYSRERKTKDK